MSYSFVDKIVWVTGASTGIGLAIAHALLKKGAFVVVTSRSEQTLIEEFKNNSRAFIAAGDLTKQQSNLDIVARIKQQFGRLDCAILNAGSAEYINVKEFSYQPFERMMTINFLSVTMGIDG